MKHLVRIIVAVAVVAILAYLYSRGVR